MIKQKSSPSKIIEHLQKVQFMCEFFILSRYSENHHAVPEMLMFIEAFKFYFKAQAFAQAQRIYIEEQPVRKPEPDEDVLEEQSTIDEEIERQKKILDLIKDKAYRRTDHYPKLFEPLAPKPHQLTTTLALPSQLKKTSFPFMHILGELVHILRPLLSIICIRLYGINSYKSYLISLLIDLFIILVLQRGLKVVSDAEAKEISRRRNQLIRRCIFRKPVFQVLKRIAIKPLLSRIVKEDGLVFRIIMSLLEMQSSISLTL